MKNLIEKLAAIEHERWSAWHKWMRDRQTPENMARWNKQADTPYAELSEEDKEKDRREVMRYWALIEAELAAQKEAIIEEINTFDKEVADIIIDRIRAL